jgi:hypothetical protein
MDYDELEEIYGGGLCRGFAEWQVTECGDAPALLANYFSPRLGRDRSQLSDR